MTKYYLAGPMSGIPKFNFPLFESVAGELRDLGYEILSPVEMDDPSTYQAAVANATGNPDQRTGLHPGGHTWADFLSRDVKVVADEVEGIMLLPGWEFSKGARLECMVALSLDHSIMRYRPRHEGRHQHPIPLTHEEAWDGIVYGHQQNRLLGPGSEGFLLASSIYG